MSLILRDVKSQAVNDYKKRKYLVKHGLLGLIEKSVFLYGHGSWCMQGCRFDFGHGPIGIAMHCVTKQPQVLQYFSFVCLYFIWVKKMSRMTCLEIHLREKQPKKMEKNSKQLVAKQYAIHSPDGVPSCMGVLLFPFKYCVILQHQLKMYSPNGIL